MVLKKIKSNKSILISRIKRGNLKSWPFFYCTKKTQWPIKCKYYGDKKRTLKDCTIGNYSDSH